VSAAIPWPDKPISEYLRDRPASPIGLEAAMAAFDSLARELSKADGNVLQLLVETAIGLCGAHSAGVSVIELDGADKVFRWRAVAGRWAKYLMGSMPRGASPCGIVVDRRAAQLMPKPEIYFPAMLAAEPLASEALLVPFEVLGETVGTVWVVSHDDHCRFHSEHLRIMQRLSHFAAAAYFFSESLRRSLDMQEEMRRSNERLRSENERLFRKLRESESSEAH